MALFGEKYGDVVRVISFENYSKELCGGTHVSSTGSIQLFTLLSESSLSSGVRRIEAMTSTGAIQYLQERSQTLQKIEQLTSTSQQVDLKIEEIMNELKEKSKELQAARQKNNLVQLQQQLKNPEMFGDLQLYCIQTTIPVADWKAFGDSFSEQFKNNSLLCLYSTDTSTDTDKMQFLLRSHTSLTFDCNMWVKKISAALAVKGGGRKDMVQGSLPLENKTQFLKDLRSAL
jgi:alanyl-tRNA synthetase